jgi:hypothetical protein
MLLAQNTAKDIFGNINPQGPVGQVSFSTILSWGLRFFFFFMGIMALYYMLMGSFEWITAGGDPKKIETARSKITQSGIALLIALVVLVGWIFLSSQILGIFKIENGQVNIKIPSINCVASGQTLSVNQTASSCCSGEVSSNVCK